MFGGFVFVLVLLLIIGIYIWKAEHARLNEVYPELTYSKRSTIIDMQPGTERQL